MPQVQQLLLQARAVQWQVSCRVQTAAEGYDHVLLLAALYAVLGYWM
jgi:hypothetical protein